MKVIKEDKGEIELEFDDVTLPEILRVYLNQDSGVSFAAWKREHPTTPAVLLVKTKGKTAKKAINDAVNSIIKDLDKVEADFKKLR